MKDVLKIEMLQKMEQIRWVFLFLSLSGTKKLLISKVEKVVLTLFMIPLKRYHGQFFKQ